MRVEDVTGIIIVVAVLALVILLAGAPIGSQRGAASRATIRAEQEASIANHELAGLTLPRVIDLIGTSDWRIGGTSGVDLLRTNIGPGGHASIDTEMTKAMVSASWGTPDAVGVNGRYIYYQPPYGEVHVGFTNYGTPTKPRVATFLFTVLYPAYFKREHPTWTDATCMLVAAERLALGMTAEMALASWGKPSDINRSVGSRGVNEQWVYRALIAPYSTRYIYFENGVLTSWQE